MLHRRCDIKKLLDMLIVEQRHALLKDPDLTDAQVKIDTCQEIRDYIFGDRLADDILYLPQ